MASSTAAPSLDRLQVYVAPSDLREIRQLFLTLVNELGNVTVIASKRNFVPPERAYLKIIKAGVEKWKPIRENAFIKDILCDLSHSTGPDVHLLQI
jgi:hypothetical protein